MENPFKNHSVKDIEQAINEALTALVGCQTDVQISAMTLTGDAPGLTTGAAFTIAANRRLNWEKDNPFKDDI